MPSDAQGCASTEKEHTTTNRQQASSADNDNRRYRCSASASSGCKAGHHRQLLMRARKGSRTCGGHCATTAARFLLCLCLPRLAKKSTRYCYYCLPPLHVHITSDTTTRPASNSHMLRCKSLMHQQPPSRACRPAGIFKLCPSDSPAEGPTSNTVSHARDRVHCGSHMPGRAPQYTLL